MFMEVGLREYWKAPMAYCFTKGITANKQKQLILDVIQALHDADVHVRVIIMDACNTNISTFNKLGGSFQADAVTFTHPHTSHEVYCMLHMCHMLKVLRNCMADLRVLTSPFGLVK